MTLDTWHLALGTFALCFLARYALHLTLYAAPLEALPYTFSFTLGAFDNYASYFELGAASSEASPRRGYRSQVEGIQVLSVWVMQYKVKHKTKC